MIHVTAAIAEFLLLILQSLLWAALSVGGLIMAGGAALWGCWRMIRRPH
jgi:hypothetical protein